MSWPRWVSGDGGGTVLFFTALAASRAASGDPQYTLTNLGDLLGASPSQATAINSAGDVVGYTGSGSSPEAFLYSGGTMLDLGAGAALGINDSDQIIGAATLTGTGAAFLYDHGSKTNPTGATPSYAWAINNAGQFLWQGSNSTVNLHSSGGSNSTVPVNNLTTLGSREMNASGQVIGNSVNGSVSQAAIATGATVTKLGTPAGAQDSWGLAINDSGQVAGRAGSQFVYDAYTYLNGTWTDLGTIDGGQDGTPTGINNSGQIVGYFQNFTGDDIAFLYDGSQVYNLNQLIPADGPLFLQQALAINDAGQIVGVGRDDEGNETAFLLTPVATPEPAICGAAIAALALVGRRRRQCA